LDLLLPPLRPGCAGDQSYTLLASAGAGWAPMRGGVVGPSVQLTNLEPYAALSFKLVAVNAAGASTRGHPSEV